MYSTIQLIIFICFCINATLAASFLCRFLTSKKPKDSINYLVIAILVSSVIWSIGMGMLSIQRDETACFVWRTIGIFGTFMFMMTVQKTMCLVSEIPKKWQVILNGISYTGLFVFAIYSTPGQTIFVHNAIGTTFYFRQGVINTIYSIYFVLVSANIFFVTVHMLRSQLKQIRAAGKRFVIVEILVFIGAMTDMVMPSFGLSAYPGSAITHFWGVCVFWYAIHQMYRSKLTVSNMSEYIYYSLDIPVLIFNSDYVLEVANDASLSYFKIDTNKSGKHINDLLQIDDSSFSFNSNSRILRSICKANNAPCEVVISKINNTYDDTIGYILIINDLTEHELVIQKLEQAKLAADSANMSKSLFLANMSHEIRTPMNAILGFSQLALAEGVDAKSTEYFTEIYHSGEILLAIINDILDISKIELGKMELHCANYKLGRLLHDTELMTNVLAQKKGLEFRLVLDSGLPTELYGDKDKLREILINILNNAVKYTNTGKVELHVKARKKDYDTSNIEFIIIDTGMGIREKELPLIFEKFKRLDEQTNSKTEGTGLGLSITKGLIDLMDGKIKIDSVYGKGSIFTVTIPQKVVDDTIFESIDENLYDIVNEIKVPDEMSNEKAKDLRILVVDDNLINLKVSTSLLKANGLSSDTASSGQEAIDLCRQKAYDLILMDQMMPEMDGVEAMTIIRTIPGYAKGSNQKIVALTANVIAGVEQELMEKGFDGFLGKPIDFAEFKRTIMGLV